MRHIRDTLSDLRQILLLPATQASVTGRLRVEQINRVISLNYIFVAAGINTLLLLIWACWRENHKQLLAIVPLTITLLYALLAVRTLKWRLQSELRSHISRCLREFNAIYFPLGISWGVLLIGLMPDGDAGERSLLYGVLTGLISTAALSVPFSLAISFGIPVAIGSFWAIVATNGSSLLPTLACLAGYIILALSCAIYLNREFISRVLHEVRLEEQKVKLQEQTEVIGLLLRDFVENSSDWLWETDDHLRLKRVSKRMAEVAGMPVEALCGMSLEALMGSLADGSGGEGVSTLTRVLSTKDSFRDLAIPIRVAGETCWWSLTGKPSFDKHGAFTGYHGIGSDITAARRSTEQISYLARHDSLTSLPNRVLFTDALARSCAQPGPGSVALLCLDLDGFKAINDTMGHAVGDALLVAVADRLRRCVREGDVAARLGGDEFALIMADATRDSAAHMASRVVDRISQPYRVNGQTVEIGVSIGVVIAQPGDGEPSRLLQNADLALYRAKAEGRRTWRFFEAAMDEQVQDRQRLRAELQHALSRGEFRLEFQPVIELASRRVVAVEALLRWLHPTRGSVPPLEFVQLAEEADLVREIGAWVISQAIREVASWPFSVVVAVNLSPLQFRDADLVSTITDTLRTYDFPAARLELEITESILLKPTAQTLDTLRHLRSLGVRIALDDFGTGYSSLSYLRRFPFDTIKIDRSFVSDLGHDKAAAAIIKAIIEIARSVQMTVTAEGVEVEEQAAILEECGCERVQGFLFSRPRPAAEARRYMEEAEVTVGAAGTEQQVGAGVVLA